MLGKTRSAERSAKGRSLSLSLAVAPKSVKPRGLPPTASPASSTLAQANSSGGGGTDKSLGR